MSVTITPSTASPRNSSRSFVAVRPFSNANDRCVRASSRSDGSRNETPSARSSASPGLSTGVTTTPLLDVDRLPAGVVAAVRADPVRELGLPALRTGAVRGGRRLPVRRAFTGARLALLLLGDG